MFKILIAATPVLFSKFFTVADREAVLAAIPKGTRRVVFVDNPATAHLIATVESLVSKGIVVIVRDHHDVLNPRNPREKEIANAANRVRELVGVNALISNRQANPACSGLIQVGEFAGKGTVIVADPDPDGLTAAMKASGLVYEGLDTDAATLDGARSEQTAERLTPIALLLVKGLGSLPPFDVNRPQLSEDAKSKLFQEFVAAASGDKVALDGLNLKVEAYEAGVKVAEGIASEASEPAPGVVMVNAAGKPRHDLTTLTQRMESCTGCRVTVVRKDSGPIAAKHGGVQYSLAVVKAVQAEINLQELLTPGFTSSPESGIISNTSFLLHVSQEVWESQVLPALRARFAA
ncbi:hypothetical protein CO173_04070 [Candidatus Uhrbacteria bacterium CG_4_9_14_3_um_filter_41_35]|uniref:Uncharacterized protein n=1 Tax=Candidatus Uhrbacteria bacterium CG_4_9_14_3_um_filter_41_35 TaxID=1975034 RepID=A0A2M7XE28_9BACT|nr:MAG: hypothetical protein COV92_03310 [Candidatus Uhrbacteria bacterium CG11_big_fil_rev_8_21_14_0_20_41_9]PJA45976.1 MAG: hypothetical protein CO173_04070 [Candidatus Uhrbacteria bacterium CG_4_9_14_3_um_filter_41_35]